MWAISLSLLLEMRPSSSISNSMAHSLVSFLMLVQLCVLMSMSSLEYTSHKISIRACMSSCCADRDDSMHIVLSTRSLLSDMFMYSGTCQFLL